MRTFSLGPMVGVLFEIRSSPLHTPKQSPYPHPLLISPLRSMMLIEKPLLGDVLGEGGWHNPTASVGFQRFSSPATVEGTVVVLNYKPGKVSGEHLLDIHVSGHIRMMYVITS